MSWCDPPEVDHTDKRLEEREENNPSAAKTSKVEYLIIEEPGRQRRLLVVSIQFEHQDLSNEPEI